MVKVFISSVIPAPADKVWGVVRDFNDMPSWHPLISGNRESVHRAGVSIQGMALSEEDIHPDDWPRTIWEVGHPL